MFLSRFGVKNYKCLADVEIPLTPIHVLIGPNDAGKTSLMEAIAALYNSSKMPLANAFPSPWSETELVFHGAPVPQIELWAEWDLSSGEATPPHGHSHLGYGFGIDFSRSGWARTTNGEWIFVDGEKRPLVIPPRSASQTALAAMDQMDPHTPEERYAQAISGLLKPTHKHSFHARAMAVPAATEPARKFALDPDGFGLTTLLMDINLYDPAWFVALRNEFCRLFPNFRSVRLETETVVKRSGDRGMSQKEGTAAGVAVYFEDKYGGKVRAQQASDGAILLLAYLALAYVPEPPNLLLLEEPENGIYPKRLGEVIGMLKELVNRKEGARYPQVILSTHSPYVLSFFEPEEVTFLSRDPSKPEAGVRARPLRDAPHIRDRLAGGDFYLGELWYNLSEEELFGEP